MKVLITYPPLESKKGIALLSQNRQFQWSKTQTFIYPVVPANAATLLKINHHQVFWLDAIVKNLSYEEWISKIARINPELILIETKTPIIKRHWIIINKTKKTNIKVKIVLVGDHVTALPRESFQNSKVDYILTGGNYDFLLLNLVNHLEKGEKLQPGIYYKKNGKVLNTGKFILNQDLNKLPQIDRDLTCWKDYAYKNGNYKFTPATYIMAGRDCWWRKNGGCKFCSWTTLYPQYQVRTVKNVVDEIEILVNKYKVKEIMDDTGTFPNGIWLENFCREIIKRKLNQKVVLSCNLRFGSLNKFQYRLLAKANFRFLLFGLESANQDTLDKLNKGILINKVKSELKLIKEINKEFKSHLEPHVTCMIGYPWENLEMAKNTIDFCQNLFKQNLINTLQATIVIPYPGSQLFRYCQKNNFLKSTEWNDYDMSKPIMKSSLTDKQIKKLTQSIYLSAITPQFILNKILSIQNFNDIFYYFKASLKYIFRIIDFK